MREGLFFLLFVCEKLVRLHAGLLDDGSKRTGGHVAGMKCNSCMQSFFRVIIGTMTSLIRIGNKSGIKEYPFNFARFETRQRAHELCVGNVCQWWDAYICCGYDKGFLIGGWHIFLVFH